VSKQAVHQALEYWGNRIERREKDRATSPKKAKRRKTKGPSTSLKLAREWIRLFTKEGWTVERIAEAFNRDVDAVRSIVDFWLPSNR
jgi:hypothetical protein